jgi:uncharacterized protein
VHLLDDGAIALSPTDLTGFAACEHLTQLELSVARGEREPPERDDPMLDVLSRRGTEHETRQLARYRAEGKTLVEIAMPGNSHAELAAAEAATLAAMRAGADVIYQATFFQPSPVGGWRGHADFLLRVGTPSPVLGPWSYEVADTKLARRVKAAALLQMCAYSEQVERLQGLAPARMHVITGDGESNPFTVTDYSAYYRALKARFETLVAGSIGTSIDGAGVATYPDPVDHCGICRWEDSCKDRRRADDHLSLVSGMRRDQTRKLTEVGVPTRRALAAMPAGVAVSGMADVSVERLRQQAALQVRGEGLPPYLFELLPPELPPVQPELVDPATAWPQRGWVALPEPSRGDLFFDMEGDPYALDDEHGSGLEYLFGVIELGAAGTPEYRSFWAHTRGEEQRAFEGFVDFVMKRRAEHPDLHVYHYAPYEPSAMKRLMGAHHTREHEVDELLRGEVFVDLYAVVRAGVRIGTESYSLKQVEKLYMQRPGGEVMDGGGSIVAYEDYLDDHDQARLDAIESYNKDDCLSTLGLRDWLEEQRTHAEELFGPIPRPELHDGAASEAVTEREAHVAELVARLTVGVPDARVERDDEQQARWLLAQMLDWHRREEKPDWWMYFARQLMSDDELADDRESISGLRFVEVVSEGDRSSVYRYEFTPQDHKFRQGSKPYDPRTARRVGEVTAVDDVAGTIQLKRGRSKDPIVHPEALIPGPPIDSGPLERAIWKVAEHVIAHGIDAPGPYRAALDLLLRRRRAPDAGPFDESYLAIQGPPGSGKTTKGAELIVGLVREGKRVGITAHSHAVIGNLLHAVCERAEPDGVEVRALQKAEDHQQCEAAIVTCVDNNDVVEAAAANREYDVIAGTAWLWARPGMANAVDVLFVDEAGQKSLADVLAVSGATTQLVLLGDPQQLAQPSKGSHPEGAEVSALEHLLGGEATMPSELGWFLESTYRMHPAVCEFVSAVAYQGRLHPAEGEGLARQAVDGFAGLRYAPVEHVGNRSWSAEEVEVVDALVRDLVGKPWTDRFGVTRPLELDDVLVVTPYNAQVAKLAAALPEGARVGTVDKFQGQEAPVTIYSMATSSADDAPRSMEFLYDLHRLNVAISRARGVTALVASPELMCVACRTPAQLKLASALCSLAEFATRHAEDDIGIAS